MALNEVVNKPAAENRWHFLKIKLDLHFAQKRQLVDQMSRVFPEATNQFEKRKQNDLSPWQFELLSSSASSNFWLDF